LQVGCEKLPGLVHRRNATNALLPEDPQFARLVMLACHDLRTPLATVHGFAHTLARSEDLDETSARYVEMINAAATQLAELIDDLSVAARLVGDRYDPPLRAVDTLELAQSAAEQLGDERVLVSGDGALVELDAEAAERAVGALARCALRHGGFEEVELAVRGPELELSPVTSASAPVLLGEDLRDLGAAVAVRVVQARGGSVAVDGETLTIRLT
jgi:signal transduction histidine kinase